MTKQEYKLVGASQEAIEFLGYEIQAGLTEKSMLVRNPDGMLENMLIQISSEANASGGRHEFGICFKHFKSKDSFVFFTGDESTFLVVPSSVLYKIF